MKTAVEWLLDEINNIKSSSTNMNGKIQFLEKELNKLFEQAKEMEKQQIIDAVDWGNRKGYDEHRLTCINDEDEQYYNETFKDKL